MYHLFVHNWKRGNWKMYCFFVQNDLVHLNIWQYMILYNNIFFDQFQNHIALLTLINIEIETVSFKIQAYQNMRLKLPELIYFHWIHDSVVKYLSPDVSASFLVVITQTFPLIATLGNPALHSNGVRHQLAGYWVAL